MPLPHCDVIGNWLCCDVIAHSGTPNKYYAERANRSVMRTWYIKQELGGQNSFFIRYQKLLLFPSDHASSIERWRGKQYFLPISIFLESNRYRIIVIDIGIPSDDRPTLGWCHPSFQSSIHSFSKRVENRIISIRKLSIHRGLIDSNFTLGISAERKRTKNTNSLQ